MRRSKRLTVIDAAWLAFCLLCLLALLMATALVVTYTLAALSTPSS